MDFIYVFTQKDRDVLLAMGYQLLKENDSGTVFVFLQREEMTFELNEIPHVCTNVLTF